VAERQDKIELFYLPCYSPQLNPEERLNADLKQEIGKRVPIRTKTSLREAANDHMAMLEQKPQRVMSYFSGSAGSICGLRLHWAGAIGAVIYSRDKKS